MEELINICVTCLSTDRCLVPLRKITMLLEEIKFQELIKSCGGVCWECWSIVAKFNKFKNRAKTAQRTLLQSTKTCNIKPLTTLASKTNILYDYEYTYHLDPLVSSNNELKVDPESIKQEIIYQRDDAKDTLDFDENISNIDEKIDIDENTFDMNQHISDTDEQISDTDEKISDIDEKLGHVFVDADVKYNNNSSKNKVNTNFAKVILSETHEKLPVITENLETLEPDKHLHKIKKEIKIEERKELQKKFAEVVLSKEELTRVREEKRNHYNFKRMLYKCDSCVLGFTKKDTYNLHMKKKHDKSIGNEICDVCSIRFRHKIALNNHKRKHYVVYRCLLCKYEGHDFVSVVNHCRTKHIADKPGRIHCPQCKYIAKTSDDLETHLQTDHVIYCDCGVRFKNKSSLKHHLRLAHSVLRNFICDICKQTFKTKTRLESHMVTHNESIAKKLAYCQQCNIQYKNIQVYRMHLRSSAYHSEGYTCSKCNKKFKSKGYLKQHNDFYHLRKSQHRCEFCNKIFISNWRLCNHKQQYHGLTRPRNHPCNVCGKKFFTSTTLRNHQYTHSEQRSFMCEDCGDTFKQRAALYTHTRLLHRGKSGEQRKKRDS